VLVGARLGVRFLGDAAVGVSFMEADLQGAMRSQPNPMGSIDPGDATVCGDAKPILT